MFGGRLERDFCGFVVTAVALSDSTTFAGSAESSGFVGLVVSRGFADLVLSSDFADLDVSGGFTEEAGVSDKVRGESVDGVEGVAEPEIDSLTDLAFVFFGLAFWSCSRSWLN